MGLPWGPQGAPWAPEAQILDFPQILLPFSSQIYQNHGTVVNFVASRNSEADLPDPADPAETQDGMQNRPWVSHAGGQDDGSLHKLPQIIIPNVDAFDTEELLLLKATSSRAKSTPSS